MSPSRDHKLGPTALPPGIPTLQPGPSESLKTTESTSTIDPDSEAYDLDSDPSDQEDMDIPEGSLFDYQIPGVLTKEEIGKLNLDKWKLVVRNMLVDFEDIRGWEQQSIEDPGSIKGIAAELAAAVGPNLLENSAVVLF